MPIFLRRIIMWLFILSFFLITPLIILKASGYSYNWKKGAFEKSGVLMIDIQPKSSNIFVNGQEMKQLFPFSAFHLEDLNPGEYNIKIEKENYHSWEKNIEVKENLTSFIDRVQLWPNEPAEMLINENISHWFYLNKQYSVYSNETENYAEIWIFNNETAGNKLIYRFVDKNLNNIQKDNFKISANNKYLVFNYENENYIFNLLNPDASQNLNKLHPDKNFTKLHWNNNNTENLYLSDDQNQIYELKANTPEYLNPIYKLNENFIDFNIIDNHLYFINDKNTFKRNNLTNDESEIILELKNDKYSLKEIDKSHWFIHNSDHSYFFQLYDNKVYYQIIPSTDIVFSGDGRKLAFVNPKQFEILTLEKFREKPESAETYLLTRYSELAKNLIWFKSNEYIFYQLNNEINVIELDGRGNSRNINKLYSGSKEIKGFSVDYKGDNLYIAEEDGVYLLNVVE